MVSRSFARYALALPALITALAGCRLPPPVYVVASAPPAEIVPAPPPSSRLEPPPPPPDGDHVWLEGYWHWEDDGYRWVDGCWVLPEPGFEIVAASYSFHGGYWHYRPPYWRRHRRPRGHRRHVAARRRAPPESVRARAPRSGEGDDGRIRDDHSTAVRRAPPAPAAPSERARRAPPAEESAAQPPEQEDAAQRLQIYADATGAYLLSRGAGRRRMRSGEGTRIAGRSSFGGDPAGAESEEERSRSDAPEPAAPEPAAADLAPRNPGARAAGSGGPRRDALGASPARPQEPRISPDELSSAQADLPRQRISAEERQQRIQRQLLANPAWRPAPPRDARNEDGAVRWGGRAARPHEVRDTTPSSAARASSSSSSSRHVAQARTPMRHDASTRSVSPPRPSVSSRPRASSVTRHAPSPRVSRAAMTPSSPRLRSSALSAPPSSSSSSEERFRRRARRSR